MTDERQAGLREALEFIADWAHDCSPSNAATPWDRQHPGEIDPRAYGFDDIEDRCRRALAAQVPAQEEGWRFAQSAADHAKGYRRGKEDALAGHFDPCATCGHERISHFDEGNCGEPDCEARCVEFLAAQVPAQEERLDVFKLTRAIERLGQSDEIWLGEPYSDFAEAIAREYRALGAETKEEGAG